MIKRLYIHNFRCFENFEFLPDGKSPVLIIGKNGVGKSSFADVLQIFQSIGSGENSVPGLVRKEDIPESVAGRIVRFELTVDIGGQIYDYRMAFEWPEGFVKFRVHEESLSVDGKPVFTRQIAQVVMTGEHVPAVKFLVDWHLLALPIIQAPSDEAPVARLRQWMKRMLILKPRPDKMQSVMTDGDESLGGACENFVGWLSSLLSASPGVYGQIAAGLKSIQRDFSSFNFERLGTSSRRLLVRYESNGKELRLPFGELSDGEKCLFLSAALRAANLYAEPLFCFWDEPDNFLSLQEIGFFVSALCRDFMERGQFIFTTHSGDAILSLADEETWLWSRNSHLEPTLPPQTLEAMRKGKTLTGDLRMALLSGEVGA